MFQNWHKTDTEQYTSVYTLKGEHRSVSVSFSKSKPSYNLKRISLIPTSWVWVKWSFFCITNVNEEENLYINKNHTPFSHSWNKVKFLVKISPYKIYVILRGQNSKLCAKLFTCMGRLVLVLLCPTKKVRLFKGDKETSVKDSGTDLGQLLTWRKTMIYHQHGQRIKVYLP